MLVGGKLLFEATLTTDFKLLELDDDVIILEDVVISVEEP